jgi:UDP-2,3-diacylglucosamine pyrophosphatase LpxH
VSGGRTPDRRKAQRVAVISDFHLGRPGSSLACTLDAAKIIGAVDALKARVDLIIVNGDLFDLERGTLPSQGRELKLLSSVHHRVIETLTGPEFVWTRGNHDRILEQRGRAFEAVDLELPSGLFRVEHGDRFDAPIKRNHAFTSTVTWVSGRVHSFAMLRPIYHAMRAADHVLTGAATASDEPIAAKAERWLATEPAYRGVVIGHTHAPILRAHEDGRLVMNPGGSTNEFRALVIDPGSASLLLWSGDGFEELATHEI